MDDDTPGTSGGDRLVADGSGTRDGADAAGPTDVAARLDACVDAAERGGGTALDSFRTALAVESKGDDPMDAVTEVDRAVQREVFDLLRERYPDDALVGEEEEALKTVPDDGAAWVVDPIDGTNNYVAGGRVWATSVACCVDGEPVAAANAFPALGDRYAAAADDGRAGGVGGSDGDGGPDSARLNGEPATTSDRSDPETFTINPIFGQSRPDRRRLVDAVDTVLSEFGDLRRAGCAHAALSGVASGELEAAVSTVRLADWDTVAGVHLIREAGGRVTDASGDRWTPGATGLVASNDEAHDALVAAFGPSE